MNSEDLIRRLHEHRQWSNWKLFAVAEGLSESQLRQQFEVGQGSIWNSLTHLYAAEYVWLEALIGNESPLTPGDARGKLPGNQEGDGAMSSLADLRARWTNLEERWAAYLEGITAEPLTEVV